MSLQTQHEPKNEAEITSSSRLLLSLETLLVLCRQSRGFSLRSIFMMRHRAVGFLIPTAGWLFGSSVRAGNGERRAALPNSALWRISRPAGLQVDRLAATRLKFKKVDATTIARGGPRLAAVLLSEDQRREQSERARKTIRLRSRMPAMPASADATASLASRYRSGQAKLSS